VSNKCEKICVIASVIDQAGVFSVLAVKKNEMKTLEQTLMDDTPSLKKKVPPKREYY